MINTLLCLIDISGCLIKEILDAVVMFKTNALELTNDLFLSIIYEQN